MPEGFLVSKNALLRFDEAANVVLGNRGQEDVQQRQEVFERRSDRFYKTPTAGVDAPSNSSTPSSATCMKMKWNALGTLLLETTVEETVYFFQPVKGDTIVKVATIGGKNVGLVEASITKPQFCEFRWASDFVSTSTTATVEDCVIANDVNSTTDSSVFRLEVSQGIAADQVGLLKAGFYTVDSPISILDNDFSNDALATFTITDDAAIPQQFTWKVSHDFVHRLCLADSDELDPWTNSFALSQKTWNTIGVADWGSITAADNRHLEFTHASSFYLSASEISSVSGYVVLKSLIQHTRQTGTGNFYKYNDAAPTRITYWGDYESETGLNNWLVDIPATGQGPILPGP